jgi:four helix bundle protein
MEKQNLKPRIYQFVLQLLSFLNALSRNEAARVICLQLTRSGTSVLANYVEGQSASSRKEFLNFLQYSLKSANESILWLELLRDTGNGDANRVVKLLKELEEITRILAASVLKLKGKR